MTSRMISQTTPPDPTPAPRTRGPNAERSSVMRRRIIEATIDCLNSSGFAATTTQHILETGGVSRGAMLHHFPTRVDLMIAVARHCAATQDAIVAARMTQIPDPLDQFLALTEASWEARQAPTGVAFIEIMLGGRSERGLDVELSRVVAELEDRQTRAVCDFARRLGMVDADHDVDTMSRLHTAAMRGLVLERLCSPRGAAADACVELLMDYKRYITGRFLTRNSPLTKAAAASGDL